jgi:hypothetical protein
MKVNEMKKTDYEITLELTLSYGELNDHFVYCEDCGKLLFRNDAICVDDEYFCNDCVTECDLCGRLIRCEEAWHTSDSDYDYCMHCYDTRTHICDDCGEHFRWEDSLQEVGDNWYCDKCYPNHEPLIAEYHSMKNYGNIVFHGEESRDDAVYIGYELEIDSASWFNREEIASELESRFGSFWNYENDGSLCNGFEIISHPASLSYHLKRMPECTSAFHFLRNNGISSHDAGTCGFHHHIDRRYFGEKEDSSIAKILYVFEKFRDELKLFSRRTNSQIDDWARSRKEHYNGEPGWIKKSMKHSYSGRYFAVNLTNTNTIELRLWRGSINPETFEATLRFTARLAELCKYTSAVELSKMTFDEILGDDPTIHSYWNRISHRNTNESEEN